MHFILTALITYLLIDFDRGQYVAKILGLLKISFVTWINKGAGWSYKRKHFEQFTTDINLN